MAPRIKIAILAGVSSLEQDEDKASIPDQIATCRRVIAQTGAVEAGCYTFRASRSGYDSLNEAMADIPELGAAIQAAERDEYDVLLLDNWDRLGDLAQLVHTRFKKYRKQIISARQSSRIQDPRTYDPYSDESAAIDMHIQGIIQSYRINKMRRGWNVGVPARVDKGLHPLAPPFGYRSVDRNLPAVQVPAETQLLCRMKDMLLRGEVYEAITRYAEASGVPPPQARWRKQRDHQRWHSSTIRTMLENPYYAGIIRLHVKPTKYSKGSHVPVWDEATWRAIVAEHKRRKDAHQFYRVRYPFTALVFCACGARINRHGKRYKYLACTTDYKHFHRDYADALQSLTGAIVREFKKFQDVPYAPVDLSPLETRLSQIGDDIAYVQEMTRRKIYSLDQGEKETAKLEEEREELKYKLEQAQEHEATRLEWHRNKQTNIDDLPLLIEHGDPAEVNHLLTALIEKIIVEKDDITIVWRAS